VPTASGAFEAAEHEAAFLAVARAEAQRVRALDQALQSSRPEAASYTPPPSSSSRYLKPLVAVAVAAAVASGALALSRHSEVASDTPAKAMAAAPNAPQAAKGGAASPDDVAPAAANVVAPGAAAAGAADAHAPGPTTTAIAQPAPSALLAATVESAAGRTDESDDDDEADDERADGASSGASGGQGAARAKVLAHQGKALLRKGRTSQAKQAFEAAVALDPSQTRALSALAKLGLKERDATAALKYAGALAKLRPKSGSSLLMLGDAQQLAGDTAGATTSWQQAAQRGSRPAKTRLTD
jgi:tetratricopeptide (TPR) repeat protein